MHLKNNSELRIRQKGCTEKPDTVRYADTVRYKTYSRGCLNTPAGEVFYTYEEEGGNLSRRGV